MRSVRVERGEPVRALPRLAQPSVRRGRLAQWLDVLHDGTPRLLVAPAGFGKTTILLQLAYDRAPDALYVRCSSDRSLLDALAAATGLRAETIAIMHALEAYPTVLLDGLETIDARDEALLDAIVQNARIDNLIGASSRKSVVDVDHLASGLISLCTPRMLAFTADEIVEFAASLGLAMGELDALDLRERCDGWPIAIAGSLRTARAFGVPPALALDEWKNDQRSVLLGILETERARLTPALQATFDAVVRGVPVLDCDARQLELAGGPLVARPDGRFVGLRIVREINAEGAAPATSPTLRTALHARLFGTFECTLDDRPVIWLRRMDRRLFRYLLLTKDGSDDRDAILERFWPGQDTVSALQSLRTTCSNIKKALASLVGVDQVGEYFSVGERIAINLDNVTVDVRRYLSHMRIANARFAVESWDDAFYHYRQADEMYSAHLGWGDEPEEWLETLAAECRNLRLAGMRATIELLQRFGRINEANDCEMLLAERSKR